MNLMVLTCAVFPTEEGARKKLWIFMESCRRFGVEPHMYGIGSGFPGYRFMKLEMQLAYLKEHGGGYTHVLYTDAWDAFFCAHLAEVIGKYKVMGSPPILSSAFHGLANVSEPEKDYPGMWDASIRYRYPHVGGYIAEIPLMIEMFERMLKLSNQTGDDCFNWYDAWAEGWFRPRLDSGCEIFQVTHDGVTIGTDIMRGRLYNTHTGETPCILHLSGGYTSPETGKDDRMVPWAKALGVIE